MAARPRDVVWAAASALGAVAAIAAERCSGGACSRCLACAVPGAGAVMLAVLGRRRRAREAARAEGGGSG